MPSRTSVLVLALATVAVLGLTACEKQNPYVTLTAGGVVVKAKAVSYCRGDEEPRTTQDIPTLKVRTGDTLGIDVPRSLAEQGWKLGQEGEISYLHYRAIPISGRIQSGDLSIYRDERHGCGEWRFKIEAVED